MKNQKNDNTFIKKIGSATYLVQIHFSKNSKDNFNDKVLRLIKNDITKFTNAS